MSFYLGKHGKDADVLDKFDIFEGQPSQAHSWAELLYQMDQTMEAELKKRSKASWILEWLKPGFSTSSVQDIVIADALMMASSTPSPNENVPLACGMGIPSITLSGSKDDWKLLLSKLTRFQEFGVQPLQYSTMLSPLLSRFVSTFENPDDLTVRQFWGNVTTITLNRAQCDTREIGVITGWINGFHYWDPAGNLLPTEDGASPVQRITLDGIVYPWRRVETLPAAYSNFRLCSGGDNSINVERDLLVGMLATSITRRVPEGYEMAMLRAKLTLPSTVEAGDHGILQPLSAYFELDPFPGKVCGLEVPSCMPTICLTTHLDLYLRGREDSSWVLSGRVSTYSAKSLSCGTEM
jgi:hypothetical protein